MTDVLDAVTGAEWQPIVPAEVFWARNWDRGQVPSYHVEEVAKFFFGRSASWLRLKLKKTRKFPETSFVDPYTGTAMVFRRNIAGKSDSTRIFFIYDIELMALSLFRLGGLGKKDPERRLAMILEVVRAHAALYGLTRDSEPVDPEDDED